MIMEHGHVLRLHLRLEESRHNRQTSDLARSREVRALKGRDPGDVRTTVEEAITSGTGLM
jgi:hypothetical protein